MSSFTTPLDVRKLRNGKWMLLSGFEYAIGSLENPVGHVEVERGFITDFASIPRPLWPVIGQPAGEYGKAAVVHDWLYRKRMWLRSDGTVQYCSRKWADDIFYEGMEVLGVKRWKRVVMWLGVRLGGWFAWRRYRKLEQKEAT